MSKSKSRGFSLIELLVVVAIILIIAAIAIPNLLRARMTANEASAVNSLRSLNEAAQMYQNAYGGFPLSLSVLGGEGSGTAPTSTSSQLIDNVLQAGVKSGYNFTFSSGTMDSRRQHRLLHHQRQPLEPGHDWDLHYFFTDQSGVIRADTAQAATSASTPIS